MVSFVYYALKSGFDVGCTDPEAELLFTTEGNLRSLTLDGREYMGIVTRSDQLIQSIDFDLTTDTLYWNDLNAVSVFYGLNTIDESVLQYSCSVMCANHSHIILGCDLGRNI